MVEILLILVGGSHSAQTGKNLLGIGGCHHLAHRDAGIELQLVGWVEAYHVLEGLVGLGLTTQCSLQLAHEIPLAGFLFAAHLMLDDFAQVGDGLVELLGVDVIIRIGVVPFFLGTPVDGVALHIADDVFGIVHPALFDIAFSQPCLCTAVDGRLGLEEPAHIGKGGSGILEVALIELRTAHQHPSLPDEGIVLSAVEPLDVLGCLSATLGPFGALLDAVALDGFLTFLDGTVVVALAQFAAVLVAYGIKGDDFGIVVLVALLFLERGIDISQGAIIVYIVLGVEGMQPSVARSIFLRRTTCHGDEGYDEDEDNMKGRMLFHVDGFCFL